MIKIGITGLTGSHRMEGYFAAYGTSESFTKDLAFARGVVPEICPGKVNVNNQQVDFEMHVIQNQQHHGVFAFTTHCDGYIILVEPSKYSREKLEELINNVLTFEKKTLQECPISIVSVSLENDTDPQQAAKSKGVPFTNIHIIASPILHGKPEPTDQTEPVLVVLAELVGRVLPNLGTDRILQTPATEAL